MPAPPTLRRMGRVGVRGFGQRKGAIGPEACACASAPRWQTCAGVAEKQGPSPHSPASMSQHIHSGHGPRDSETITAQPPSLGGPSLSWVRHLQAAGQPAAGPVRTGPAADTRCTRLRRAGPSVLEAGSSRLEPSHRAPPHEPARRGPTLLDGHTEGAANTRSSLFAWDLAAPLGNLQHGQLDRPYARTSLIAWKLIFRAVPATSLVIEVLSFFTHIPFTYFLRTMQALLFVGMAWPRWYVIELDAVGRQFEPYLTTGCMCTATVRTPLRCGLGCRSLHSRGLIKLRQLPPFFLHFVASVQQCTAEKTSGQTNSVFLSIIGS